MFNEILSHQILFVNEKLSKIPQSLGPSRTDREDEGPREGVPTVRKSQDVCIRCNVPTENCSVTVPLTQFLRYQKNVG